jgi:cellulose synthase/poly-beta-1,6-N-acetylglucosamine synthase-like glycosyltransferase
MITGQTIFLSVVFWLFAAVTAIQLFYYFYFYLAPAKPKGSAVLPAAPVSVIICARNEVDNLREYLPYVLKQDYPDFEVIVVNDCSEDDSYLVLGELLQQYPRLRVSTLTQSNFVHGKKFAQFIGIKAAKNELLLFTDADCRPESDKWLSTMTPNFDEKTSFVLGYGGYMPGKGLLNRYIRYDTMTIAMQYAGMTRRGMPYMGVGRNLAYRRSTFFSNKGFGSHSHIASGDDDLFINQNASGKNTMIEFRKEAHTRSVAAKDLAHWAKQKKRHLTTAPFYKMRDKIILFTEPASRVLHYASFAIMISRLVLWQYVAAIFGIRLITMFCTIFATQKKLNEKGILPFSLIFDIFSPVINGVVYIGNLRNKPGNAGWK